MKRLFLAIISIALLDNVYALDTSCLLLRSQSINVGAGEVIQVESESEIYPLQGGVVAPIKWFSQNKTKEYLDYSVVQASGIKGTEYSLISDNNPTTFIQFSKNPKSITLKLNTAVSAGEFGFSMDADVFDLSEIEISNDGKSFESILLSDIEFFDFQYIRISFVDTLKNSKTKIGRAHV